MEIYEFSNGTITVSGTEEEVLEMAHAFIEIGTGDVNDLGYEIYEYFDEEVDVGYYDEFDSFENEDEIFYERF